MTCRISISSSVTPLFLVSVFDSLKPAQGSRYFMLYPNEDLCEISEHALTEHKQPFVAYEVPTLIDSMPSSKGRWLDGIMDVDLALCLRAGKPRRECIKAIEKTFLHVLKDDKCELIQPYLEYCFKARRSVRSTTLLKSVFHVAQKLKACWNESVADLDEKGEARRFFDVEIPASRILYKRQLIGLRINEQLRIIKLEESEEKASKARERLRALFGLIDPDNGNLVRAAILNDRYLSNVVDVDGSEWQLESLLKAYSAKSELALWLRQYRKVVRSRKTLLQMCPSEAGRIHPRFECLGTVTGRVLVKEPLLQNIAKGDREVLAADRGMTLVYPDYCQCEPGIMAHDSGDAQFQSDYNAGDVYQRLATVLDPSGNGMRDLAKLLFLFFCYGMSRDRITVHASELFGLNPEIAEKTLAIFFGRYAKLVDWRHKLARQLHQEGRIGTALGNFRCFDKSNSIDVNLRGAQSQRIQGTAALILKKVIIGISRDLPEVDILLPMHDALLLQVPKKCAVPLMNRVTDIMISCYREVCPSIMPRVSLGSFSQL